MNIINQAINAILQLALFTFIPFAWYLVCNKKCAGFFQWIGLKRPTVLSWTLLKPVAVTIVAFIVVSVVILYSLKGVATATSTFSGMGYVNEKKANGSIVPSWIIHGIANLFSAIITMFSIIT